MTTNNPNTNPAKAEGTAPTLPFHYYLSVLDFQGSSIRTSEMEFSRSQPIRTIDDVQDVKQWLRTEHGFVNPQVSFSLLRNDLAKRGGRR
jgi:hypothetical protein